ncbi:MAG: hypothetical protein COV35_00750 [Alphaproteobacteria bacterium CG11_big_fil_rev_8_21_14_0_20_39_49]|nr:MAG: hypothetical protein COV35_00750 [Alphaproteobacteria bacterium CG11_big_fil_rev_8_21_14_0_20_39_49]
MNQFSADIAGILEIAVIAAGLITLYFAGKEKSVLLKSAAWLMIVGGIAVGLCTTYWWFTYHKRGYFEHPASMQVNSLPADNITHHYYREGTVLEDANPGDMVHPAPED